MKPEYVIPPLHPFCVPLSKVQVDPKNLRFHSERNIETIMSSLARFGQRIPVIANKKGVLAKGNGTFEAAKRLGWTHIAAVFIDDSDLDHRAFAVLDNRAGELADWDFQGLAARLKFLKSKGFDLDLTGWLDFEVDPLLQADWKGGEEEGVGGAKDTVPLLVFTEMQFKVVKIALRSFRGIKGNKGASDADALTAICQAYLQKGTGK